MIKLITFDLDNTLWEVTPVIIKAEKTMRAWIGERLPEFAGTVTGDLMTQLRTTALASDPQLRYNISELRVLLLSRSFEHCGLAPAAAQNLAAEAFEVFMLGRNAVEFYPQALPAIEALGKSYRMGALTNGNADISGMELANHFEFSVSPEKVQARKPEPAIFSATLELAGVAAHEVIHVGDHLHEDIDGAAAAGWQTVWVNLAGEELPKAPAYSAVVSCLSELPDAIDALAAGADLQGD